MRKKPAVSCWRRAPSNDDHRGHFACSLSDPHRPIPPPSGLVRKHRHSTKSAVRDEPPQHARRYKGAGRLASRLARGARRFYPIDSSLDDLDPGEQEAITLALELSADTLLIDDKDGREAAQLRGLAIMGTLRVLYDAAGLGLCDLEDTFNALRQTNFHGAETLYQHFLALHKARS